jgi:gliding motility-associated-like protein
MKKIVLITLCMLLILAKVSATHIVGGNIHYQHNGGNSYTIIMKIYRDCFNGISGFDDPASIGAFDVNGNLLVNIEIPLSSATITELPIDLDNLCLNPPTNVCVEECRYDTTLNLTIPNGGLQLAYQRCCRNTSIVNTASNDDIGMTITAFIPDLDVAAINSNPAYINYPPIFICLNQPFEMDHSAADADGDQLVYSFCNPLLENVGTNYINPPGAPPYPQMNFYPEFSASYPIASNPAFEIDPVTGILTGTPIELGQYVVGICVEEYRNGVLLSSTNRDFQFNVTICDPNIVASIQEQTDFCAGASVEMFNNSTNATTYHWDFGVVGIENDTSNLEQPTYTFPEPGIFEVMLVVNPGWPCADTAYSTVSSFPAINPEIVVEEYACINNEDHYLLSVISAASNLANFVWDFGPNSIPNSSNNEFETIVTDPSSAFTNISVTITDNGCIESDFITIENPPDPEASILPQSSFCDGMTYDFQSESENAESFLWNFDDESGLNESTVENPEYTFSQPGNFEIMLIVSAENACPDTAWLNFVIFPNLEAFFEQPDAQCFGTTNFSFEAIGANSNAALYSWDFGSTAIPSTSTLSSPNNIVFANAGWNEVTLSISENGCTSTHTDSILVIQNFTNEFHVHSIEDCAPVLADYYAETTSDIEVFYYWEFGDGESSTEREGNHTYHQTGVYTITGTAFTNSSCTETHTEIFENVVRVMPSPIAGFYITPQQVDVANPLVEITDASQGSISCEYVMSDGGSNADCNFEYTWNATGIQNITQIVTNEYGCSATVSGEVIISGFIIYVPNSFSPDYDGLNDEWLPIVRGATSYSLTIFNRWGELIFETDEVNKPWLGEVNQGDYFAQDGIYVYHILAEDLSKLPHEHTGHIVLTR